MKQRKWTGYLQLFMPFPTPEELRKYIQIKEGGGERS